MKKILLIITVSFMINQGISKYAGSFLEIGVGARAISMGNAYTAMMGDGYAFFWNPAGLATLTNFNVIAQHAKLFNGLENHNVIGVTRPIMGGNYISFNWVRLTVPDIAWIDSDNRTIYGENGWSARMEEASRAQTLEELIALGTVLTDLPLSYSDFTNDAFYISFTKMNYYKVDFGWQYFVLPVEMPIGLNVKLLRQKLFSNSASGFGIDFGWMLRFGMNDLMDNENLGKLTLGAAVKDIFRSKLTWDTPTESSGVIERSINLGVSYWQPIKSMNSSLVFAYDTQKKYDRTHHFGVEFLYGQNLGIRFGLNDGEFAAGVGMKIWLLQMDYAYIGHDLGNSHRISLSLGL
ncbi:MAG: hypothetical protein Kow00108_26540 [Calditrichia bacterium]